MAQSLLSITAFIYVISLVRVQGRSTAKFGDECFSDSVCGEGSCVNGVCQKPLLSGKSQTECGNFTCLPGETCEYPLVECAAGAFCPTPPPKCFPIPSIDTIKPNKTKCGHKICQPDEICLTAFIRCYEGGICIPPPPKCVPKQDDVIKQNVETTNPCAFTTCLEGYDCVQNEEDSKIAECKPRDPCANITCKNGYMCNVVTINCLVAPCPPNYPECVPINPCTTTTCSEGNVCTQKEYDPTVAECVITPCATVRCRSGFKCEAITENCTTVQCPRPRAQCVPDPEQDPCALVDCRSGYICKNVPVDNCEELPCSKYRVTCELPDHNP